MSRKEKKSRKREMRHKKKRKLVEVEMVEEEEPAAENASLQIEDRPRESPSPKPAPSLPAALPSFPLPTIPDAPPKSVLALQGIDQALIQAEVIDTTIVQPIQEGEGDDKSGLSNRTKVRLKELGITELFAGLSSRLAWLCN